MHTYDFALVSQQRRREAFLANRNFTVINLLFIAANVGYWVVELVR